MKLFLGIDGGQSSTTAVIGDENGHVLGSGRGGPCNHVKGPGGREKFITAIVESVGAACDSAGILPTGVVFGSLCAGFSGGPADKEDLLREIVRADAYEITTDAVIALSGATAGNPGIIAIAGTGSICYGRDGQRRFARAGGWGYLFGDEGGAFDLTRQALRAILRHEEGWGPATILYKMLLEAAGAQDANDLLHRFYTTDYPRPQIASYSKLVDDAANHGDSVARTILLNAAQQIAICVSAVRQQLFKEGEPAKVAYIGGVFRSVMLLERFRMLVELTDGNSVIPPQYGPAVGALIEAYAGVGLNPHLTSVPTQEK